ncbi:MAG TPA: VWA domain-containing protein [Anaerolineaceae bacterium]|nr:VWA domain-containing protein [Anaerolineaceae bacterium]
MENNKIQLKINAEQSLIAREVPSQRVLEITVVAPTKEKKSTRAVLNLALVIDRSGSMSGEKLEYVKQAAAFVVDRLEENDLCALVAYDDQVHLLSSSIKMTGANRNEMKRLIREIRIGGTTNLSGGWLQGCQEVAATSDEKSINRTLLLTDGLANAGITDLEELAKHARELANRGVSTSTFGVGLGFNEHLLEAMSNQGRGNFYFIETPMQIPDIFLKEFNELATITASDVEIELEIPTQVNVELLGGWANNKKDGKFTIFAGNLYSGQNQEIYLKVLTPPAADKKELDFSARVMAKDEDGKVIEDKAKWIFRYADAESVQKEDRQQDLLERYATVEMADRSTEALKLERAGEREKAHRLMNQSIQSNMPYLSEEILEKYQNTSHRMKRGMDETDRKSTQYDAYRDKRRRGG